LITVEPAHAIPPPDLIINILTPALQLLGVVMGLFVVTLYSVKDYLLTKAGMKTWLLVGALGLVLFGGVAFIVLKPSPITQEGWREEVIQEIDEIKESLLSDEDIEALKSKNAYEKTWGEFLELNTAGTKGEAQQDFSADQAISAQEFLTLQEQGDLTVVDLREQRGRDRGLIPDSVHIRLVDFLKGDWVKIKESLKEPVVLVCFTGARGSLATSFLSEIGFEQVYYLDGGITEAVKTESFPYEGEITLGAPDNIVKILSPEESQTLVSEGSIAVDVRFEKRFERNKLPNSINLFRDSMKTAEIQEKVQALDPSKSYFSVCDSWYSCYSAKILGFELEEQGLTFQGRYNKPYAYPR
jgi:thiosulfate sulfurtransferase